MICQDKVKKVQEILASKEIDALIVLNFIEMLYFCGTLHGNLLLVSKKGQNKLFSRRAINRTQSEVECGEVISFKSYKEIKEHLPRNFQKIGFIFDNTPVDLFEKVMKDLSLNRDQVVDLSRDIKNMKMIKSEKEIKKIKKAGKIVEQAYRHIHKRIKPGMSENEVAIEIEYLLRKNGHLGENRFRSYNQIGLLTYVLSDKSVITAGVHATPYAGSGTHKMIGVGSSHWIIEEGMPFMIDTVGNFEGYHNDTTRTFCFGKPKDQVSAKYNDLLEIYHFIIELLKPGNTCEEVYQKTLEKVAQMGYKDHFMGLGETRVPFMGHGIGIEVDEFPVFANRFAVPLQAGMTVALEPKLFFEEIGGVGIESTFLITENGNEIMTGLDDQIIII